MNNGITIACEQQQYSSLRSLIQSKFNDFIVDIDYGRTVGCIWVNVPSHINGITQQTANKTLEQIKYLVIGYLNGRADAQRES